jgi:hypothetical protein
MAAFTRGLLTMHPYYCALVSALLRGGELTTDDCKKLTLTKTKGEHGIALQRPPRGGTRGGKDRETQTPCVVPLAGR